MSDSDVSEVKLAFDNEGQLLDKTTYKCSSYNNDKTKSKKRLFLSLGCCFIFFLFELIFGLIANSLALVSDSFHMLSDATGFIISIVAIYFSGRHATKNHSFGFHRVEIIGVLVSILLIWVITVFLVKEAIDRLRNPKEINGKVMLITAIIGIIMNILLFFILGDGHDGHGHGHSHGHSHGGHSHGGHGHSHGGHHHHHDHESDKESDKELNDCECHDEEHGKNKNIKQKIKDFDKNMNINVKSAFIHVLGDLLSSIGVLIASIIICINKDLVFFDPICTFVFSILIIITTFNLLRQSLAVIMESTPREIDTESIVNDLLNIQGVDQVHDLHIWNLTVGKPSMIVHIVFNVDSDHESILCTFERILYEAQMIICSNYHIHHTTIQLEPNKKSKDCKEHDHYTNLFTEHCEPEMCHIYKKNK